MTQNNHCSLILSINKENKIKITILNDQNKEEIIKLNSNQQDDYLPILITFDMNEIIFGIQSENSINFMKEWIEQPSEYKEYKINYQNKDYNVISELLFALFIDEYKKKIEKFLKESYIIQWRKSNQKILYIQK